MEITFNNKTVDSKHFNGVLEPDLIKEVRDTYYVEDRDKALKQLEGVLLKGKVSTNHIYSYYFERIANDGVLYHSKFSINEMLSSDELTQLFINKTKTNPKVFNGKTLTSNVKTAIRLGGKGIVAKLTNFPLKECVKLLDTHKIENATSYLDPSCGWGIRMIASAILDLDYIGFDVNEKLIERLNELGKDIQKFKPNFKFTIYEQGSQYFVPELVGKADIIFTSPPYFNLEDYVNNQFEENKNIMNDYDLWVSDFVNPLMDNLKQYASENAKIMINVKNFKDYLLLDDFIKAGELCGLKHIGYDSMKNNVRVNGSTTVGFKQKVDNSEYVIIFEK